MYFSHCLHHCIFNIQMLSHSPELERRAAHTAIRRSLVWTNCWQYSVISLFCELFSSRWSCRMNSLQTKLPSCWKVCEMVMHTCSKHMTIFAEEQVWLLYFVLVHILSVIFADQSLFYVFGLMQIWNCCNTVTQNATESELHSMQCTLSVQRSFA